MADVHAELGDVLTAYLLNDPDGEERLAGEFEVSVSIVRGWRSGTARPHPAMARMVIEFVDRQSKTP
jgi:hypothetical protein